MSLDNVLRRPSAIEHDAPVPLKEQGSFDDLELTEILNKPMSALPLGPEDGVNHYSSDESHDHEHNESELSREDMIARVQKQVNFYYGDRNYPTDKFLRKHTKAHPDGWVPLSVLAIYKKMKKLTQDPELLAESLAPLEVVELSVDRLCVRRRNPPPKEDAATIAATTVVVTNFPHPYMELSRMLAPYGRIARSRCLQPSDPLPAEVAELCPDPTMLPPSLQSRSGTLWLVEYDYADEAATAVNELDGNVPYGVSLLYKKPRKKQLRLGTCPSPSVLMMQGANRNPRSHTSSPVPGGAQTRGGQRHGRRGHGSVSPRFRDASVDSAVMLSPYNSNPNSQANSPMMRRRTNSHDPRGHAMSQGRGHPVGASPLHYVPPHQQHSYHHHHGVSHQHQHQHEGGWGSPRARTTSLTNKGRRISPPQVSPLVKSHTADTSQFDKPVRRNLDFHPAPGYERSASPHKSHRDASSPRPGSPMDSNWRAKAGSNSRPAGSYAARAASPLPVRQPSGPGGQGFSRRVADV
eukprot:m.200875 g.200875  ORF g.200875 m.200875 type:complete len:521 (-) comp17056_c0_seq12:1448-3010(-)